MFGKNKNSEYHLSIVQNTDFKCRKEGANGLFSLIEKVTEGDP